MKQRFAALITGTAVSLVPCLADAHVSVASGYGFANTSQEITFGVGHGCSGSDTYSVRIEIPAGVTSVRAETSDFGRATVEKDAAQNVVAVHWQKADADVVDSDANYYKLVLRLKVPNAPFTTITFPTHQTCRMPDGGLTTVDWVAVGETDGGAEPAPQLKIVPAHRTGWNKLTVPVAVSALGTYFDDAQIVWKGNQAFSANPATAELIQGTSGVEALTALAAGDEVWVKY
jgi:uncharacterized protein YcnI